MRLQSVSYRSLHHGRLGVEIILGGEGSPWKFSVVDLLALILYVRKSNAIQLVEIVLGDYESDPVLDHEPGMLMRTLRDNGFNVWARLRSPQTYPTWLDVANGIAIDIRSEPWLNCRCSILTFYLDTEANPRLSDSTAQAIVQGRTVAFVAVSKSADIARAVAFIKGHGLAMFWGLEIPPKWSLSYDLAGMKDLPGVRKEK